MRQTIALMMALLFAAVALSGCQKLVDPADKPISVYATNYPIYALTDAVMADIPNAQLHCLIQPQDGCLRDYRLSDWDVALLERSADAVILGGRGLESFESALFAWGGDGPAVSALLYNLELYNQSDAAANGEAESHLDGANPHLYMSLDGAKQIIESAEAMLVSLDPMYAGRYAANADAALVAIDALKAQISELTDDLRGERVILMGEALIYVANDYGLEVADWIDREPATAMYDDVLADCLERLKAANANVILIEKQAPPRFVQALEEAGYAVACIDILSTHRGIDGFETYLRAQEANAQAIAEAFARAENMEGSD